jgi:hypothetical protein
MQRLLPASPERGTLQTCFRSDDPPKNFASALLGQILAGRYKILKVIDSSTFKGHDLALDQTVNVREEPRVSQGDRDIWRQRAKELMQVRDPNFLNVIDMVCNGSSDFVISEYPRGRLIAELLGGRSPLAPDDVVALIGPLADALDLIAVSGICTASFSTRLVYTEIQRSFNCRIQSRSQRPLPPLNDSPSSLLKLDVWELVKPRKDSPPSLLGSKAQKIGSKKLAVCQMALLAYELLGGEKPQETEVEHWFKPARGLGKAGNAILHRALRGSPYFKNAKGFLHKLESAIRVDTSHWHTREAETRRNSVAYPGTNDVLRKFNRDTQFLAAGLFSGVVCAALLFAVLMPESRSDVRYDLRKPNRAKSDLVVNAKAAEASRIEPVEVDKSESLEIAANNDQKFGEISAKEDFPDTKASPEPNPSSAIVSGPDISRNAGSLNQGKLSLRQRQDPRSAIREKTSSGRSRSSGYPRTFDVKKQLIALWRKSLQQAEQPQAWTITSKPNTKKKAASIAETKP